MSDRPDADIAQFAVRPDDFARHLDAITDRRMHPLTISELTDALSGRIPLPSSPVVVTFDDGFADTLTTAAPMLAERNHTATVYVTTASLPGCPGSDAARPSMIPYRRIVELEALGLEVGAHTHTHPELDVLSAAAAASDIECGKDLLERALEHGVRSFAYPYGYASSSLRDVVRTAGFDSACGVRRAFSHIDDDPFFRARLAVRSTTSVDEIGGWLDGVGAPVATANELLRTAMWRSWRRTFSFRPRSPVAKELADFVFAPTAHLRSRRTT